jgi:hypothetical protein
VAFGDDHHDGDHDGDHHNTHCEYKRGHLVCDND